MNVKRLEKTINEINQFGYSDQGINRLAYTELEQQALEHLIVLFEKEGMKVEIDVVGNMIARREGTNPTLPAVACGSHIDTVYEGGKYDGTVGVITALEVIRRLNEEEIETEHPIEIISFACEESARFGVSTIGSKAMSGMIDIEDINGLIDKDGISLKDAFSNCSLSIEKIELAKRNKNDLKVFLELHIEQGPILENEKKEIGIVTGIAAPTRFKLQVNGKSSHSGSTPMNLRKDSFSGAAEIALALEEAATAEAANGTVATVGVCEVKPGAMNIVPGVTEMNIDIRSISTKSKEVVINELFNVIRKIEKKRNLKVIVTKLSDEMPVLMNSNVIQSLVDTCEQKGFSYINMPSGAGHDAMNMAHLCPTGLFFVPSRDGLSHNPDEYTSMEQICIGATLLKEEIIKWARPINTEDRSESYESKYTKRALQYKSE